MLLILFGSLQLQRLNREQTRLTCSLQSGQLNKLLVWLRIYCIEHEYHPRWYTFHNALRTLLWFKLIPCVTVIHSTSCIKMISIGIWLSFLIFFNKTSAMFRRYFTFCLLVIYEGNLWGDYHNPLPAKLVHTWKINLRWLVICWKTRW